MENKKLIMNDFSFNKYDSVIKKSVSLIAYTYIYYVLIHLFWQIGMKIYLNEFEVKYLLLIFIYIALFLVPFIYKKNELYVIILMILILQVF